MLLRPGGPAAWYSRPPVGTQIDWGLAPRGLRMATILNGAGLPVDLVTGQLLQIARGSVGARVAGAQVVGQGFDLLSDPTTLKLASRAFDFLDQMSVFILFSSASWSSNKGFCGIGSKWVIYTNTSSNQLTFEIVASGSKVATETNSALYSGVPVGAIGVYDKVNALLYTKQYGAGGPITRTVGSAGTANIASISSDFSIGNYTDSASALTLTGGRYLCYLADRAWTPQECADLLNNPYYFFVPEGPRVLRWFGDAPAPAAGGGSLIASLDAAIQRQNGLAQASLDAALQRQNAALASLDAALSAARTATAQLDAALSAGKTGSALLDAAVQSARTATVSLDAALQTTGSGSATLDAAVQAARTLSASLDAALQASRSATASLDAYLIGASGAAVTAQLDAALQKAQSVAASLDAAIQRSGLTASASLDAALAKSQAIVVLLDVAVARTNSADASLDAALRMARTLSVGLDAKIGAFTPSTKRTQIARAYDGVIVPRRGGKTTTVH